MVDTKWYAKPHLAFLKNFKSFIDYLRIKIYFIIKTEGKKIARTSLLENLFVNGYSIWQQSIQLFVLAGVSFLTYKNYKAEWVHKLVVVLLSLLLLMALLFFEKPLSHI